MKSMRTNNWFFLLGLCFIVMGLITSSCDAAGEDSVAAKCINDISKVMKCQSYAMGRGDRPSGDCCDAVKSERDSDPVCLCYTIQQVSNASSPFSTLGLRADRLLQLPAQCMLTNASSSDCPRLLNLPPNSPEIALFNGSTSAPTGTTNTANTPRTFSGSYHFKPNLVLSISVAVAITVLKIY